MRNAARTRRARFVVPCRRPRRPRHRPRQQSCHGLCFKPRRSRALVTAHPRRVSREAASVVSSKARPAAISDRHSPCSCSSASRSLTSQHAGPAARLEIVWPPATCAAADWRLSGKRAHLLFFPFRLSSAAKPVAARTRRSLRLWRGRGATGGAAQSYQVAFSHLTASEMSTASANFTRSGIRSTASRPITWSGGSTGASRW